MADATLEEVLGRFGVAPPGLLDRRGLLRRVDSKYLAPADQVPALLAPLASAYAILHAGQRNVATYRSLYLDTKDLRCFHDHRRGRRLRHKVRLREYPEREVSYLEIKSKYNKALTVKRRLSMPYGDTALNGRELDFLRDHTGQLADELSPLLWINYRRITLLSLNADERVTIDLDLEVVPVNGPAHPFRDLAIVEIKRDPTSSRSLASATLAAAGVREQSFSKYVHAIALVRPEERRNRLLPSLRSVERILR